MCKRMESFVEPNNILFTSQYGFLNSTQHAVLDILTAIQINIDKRLFSCGIFIDLKKEFDIYSGSLDSVK